MKETDIQASICDYLALKRHFFWRNNNTPIFSEGRYRAMPKYARRGVPDIIVVNNGFIGIEVKRPKAKLLEHQEAFRDDCIAHGGRYITANSVDDIIAAGL